MINLNQNIRIYGTNWCSDCTRSKVFLDNHQIEYSWFNIELNPELQKYVRKINNGKQIVPTIIFSDNSVLVEPSNKQLAQKLNISY
jgi:glutaredoxin